MAIKQSSKRFLDEVETLISENIDLRSLDSKKAIFDYKKKKSQYYLNNLKNAFNQLHQDILELPLLAKENAENRPIVETILNLFEAMKPYYEKKELEKLLGYAQKLSDSSQKLHMSHQHKFSINIPKLPVDITSEVSADLREIEKCFNNDCLRSSIILCGRILETSLHRKYYEATGIDLLEKAPGMGLGKLIAKLQEKAVDLPSGLKQQVHLINQVRIYTVHKKQTAFIPSKQQANAIILFTIDILEKLF
jgi:hypothetical protein